MNKSVEFTESMIRAKENGATCFMFPIKKELTEVNICKMVNLINGKDTINYEECFINRYAPLQIGDKDVFIQEEFAVLLDGTIQYCSGWSLAKTMTKEQSRYSIDEVIDVRLIRLENIEHNEIVELMRYEANRDGCSCYMSESPCDGCFLFDLKKEQLLLFKDYYNIQLKEQNINSTYEEDVANGKYTFLIEVK